MSSYVFWTIEGQRFTVKDIQEKVNINYTSARNRLNTCTTLKELLKPKASNGKGNNEKIYTVENKKFTTKQLAEELGTNIATARYRLLKAKTIDELYKPIRYDALAGKRNYPVTEKEIEDRKMFKLAMGII